MLRGVNSIGFHLDEIPIAFGLRTKVRGAAEVQGAEAQGETQQQKPDMNVAQCAKDSKGFRKIARFGCYPLIGANGLSKNHPGDLQAMPSNVRNTGNTNSLSQLGFNLIAPRLYQIMDTSRMINQSASSWVLTFLAIQFGAFHLLYAWWPNLKVMYK